MSQSDFFIRAGHAHSDVEATYTGSAGLNSGLSNPLTSSIHHRVYNEENKFDWLFTRGLFFVSSSVSGGMFINIDENKSVSLRVWGRTNILYGDNNSISLLAKHNSYNTTLANNGIQPASGYEFGTRDTGLFYTFGNYRSGQGAVNFLNVDLTNKWVGLRMDIIPVKINKIINGTPTTSIFKDIVKLYTASYDAPDNWSQVGSTHELLSDGNSFVPWGSYTPYGSVQGAGQTVLTSSYGFYAACQRNLYNPSRMYFDDFQIFVEDAY